MAAVGFRIGGKDYGVSVTDPDDAREELVEFASFAGKSAQAFGFSQKQAERAWVNADPFNEPAKADGFFDGLTASAVKGLDEPAENYIDFDKQKLVLDERTFDLEWLGRGGVTELPRFAQEHKLAYSEAVQDSLENKPVSKETGDTGVIWGEKYAPKPQNVVSSVVQSESTGKTPLNILLDENANTKHRPLLDIDFPAALIPSTTPGHYHLYLDKVMTHEQYDEFVQMLHKFGILAKGNYGQMDRHGATFLRLPWVKKGFLG